MLLTSDLITKVISIEICVPQSFNACKVVKLNHVEVRKFLQTLIGALAQPGAKREVMGRIPLVPSNGAKWLVPANVTCVTHTCTRSLAFSVCP